MIRKGTLGWRHERIERKASHATALVKSSEVAEPNKPQQTTEVRYRALGAFVGGFLGFGLWLLLANLFSGKTGGIFYLLNIVVLLGCLGFPLIGGVIGYNFFYTVTRRRF